VDFSPDPSFTRSESSSATTTPLAQATSNGVMEKNEEADNVTKMELED
jgi:hypothetical protein